MLSPAADLLRTRLLVEARDNNKIIVGKKSLVNFSSNDYLGLANHPYIQKMFIQGVQEYGSGSGSSALISGFYRSHRLLEDKFAEFLNRDSAILFNSGYLANIGVITALSKQCKKIFSDKLCHASILDGIQLSRAKSIRYRHNDIEHLSHLMTPEANGNLLITESVFSMEGKISPIDQIIKQAETQQMQIMLDDAHGIGVLGKTGAGACEHFQLSQQQVPYLMLPLGKAFCSMGAIVAGSKELIENIIQQAKTYRYTTALPPAVATATLAALNIIIDEQWRRQQLQENIRFFINAAKARHLALISEDLTPIKPILIGDNQRALDLKKILQKRGFFISCIRPPTVPVGTARIRISLNSLHTQTEIIELLDLMAEHNEKSH